MTKTAQQDVTFGTIRLPNGLIQSYLNAFVQFQAAPWLMWAYMSRWTLPGTWTQQVIKAPASAPTLAEAKRPSLPPDVPAQLPAPQQASRAADPEPSPPEPALVVTEPAVDELPAPAPVQKRAAKTATAKTAAKAAPAESAKPRSARAKAAPPARRRSTKADGADSGQNGTT